MNTNHCINNLINDLDNYIGFYNYIRLQFHQTLDYKKPMDAYQESIKLNKVKARIA